MGCNCGGVKSNVRYQVVKPDGTKVGEPQPTMGAARVVRASNGGVGHIREVPA